jgi:hypothetical protein
MEWWLSVGWFRSEPQLMEDYLSDEPDLPNRNWPDRILESADCWRASYKVVLAQLEKYPDWQVLTHEELSANPVSTFRTLFESLDLPWSDSVQNEIVRLTQQQGKTGVREGRVQDFHRDSADIFETRRDSIPKEKREKIFDIVENVALEFYTRESFAID